MFLKQNCLFVFLGAEIQHVAVYLSCEYFKCIQVKSKQKVHESASEVTDTAEQSFTKWPVIS